MPDCSTFDLLMAEEHERLFSDRRSSDFLEEVSVKAAHKQSIKFTDCSTLSSPTGRDHTHTQNYN